MELYHAVFLMFFGAWILGVIFHYYFVPKLDEKESKRIVVFAAGFKKARILPEAPLPKVYIKAPDEFFMQNPNWALYGGAVDMPIEGYYHKTWNRIIMVEGCRQNILAHALAHYVQMQYGPMPKDEEEMEKEAWHITRLYLKTFYPIRYWTLTIPYGVYNWWSSAPY